VFEAVGPYGEYMYLIRKPRCQVGLNTAAVVVERR